MDDYTFIATMTGHLAWPITTLLFALIFLFRLRWLASFIKSVRFKDVELSIREDFTEARVVAESLEVERKPDHLAYSYVDAEKVARLVEIDPSIAIVEIWRRLEQQIIKLIQHNGLMRFTNPIRFIEYLVELGKLSDRDLVLFRKLRDIRNASVHAHEGTSLSKAEVYEFSGLVELLIEKVETIRQSSEYIDIPPRAPHQE